MGGGSADTTITNTGVSTVDDKENDVGSAVMNTDRSTTSHEGEKESAQKTRNKAATRNSLAVAQNRNNNKTAMAVGEDGSYFDALSSPKAKGGRKVCFVADVVYHECLPGNLYDRTPTDVDLNYCRIHEGPIITAAFRCKRCPDYFVCDECFTDWGTYIGSGQCPHHRDTFEAVDPPSDVEDADPEALHAEVLTFTLPPAPAAAPAEPLRGAPAGPSARGRRYQDHSCTEDLTASASHC